MAGLPGAPTSADACLNIVHSLMCHRVDGDTELFCRKAIESLVKKLKEKRDELDSLITSITTSGATPTKCITIPRTLDGRLQVAGRKGFPHVMYSRIWRWPDVHKNELKHLKFCQYGFDMKLEGICVNPYHYERVMASGIDLSGLSIHQSDDNFSPGGGDQSLSPDHLRSHHHRDDLLSRRLDHDNQLISSAAGSAALDQGIYLSSFSAGGTNSSGSAVVAMSSAGPPTLMRLQSMPAMQTTRQPGYMERQQATQLLSSASTAVSATPAAVVPRQLSLSDGQQQHLQQIQQQQLLKQQQQQLHQQLQLQQLHQQQLQLQQLQVSVNSPTSTAVVSEYVQSPSDVSQEYNSGNGSTAAYTAGQLAAASLWNNGSVKQENAPLSSRPVPEYWCSIAYFELDQNVGEMFKVPWTTPNIQVDGYTNPSSPERFCLGKLTNVHRSEIIEKARLHIGKGVELVRKGEGDVWVRCLSDHSIFVESYYLDREAGRAPGDAVHKIYPAAFIKVFDLNQCHGQMRQWVMMSQDAAISQATALAHGNAAPIAGPGGFGCTNIGADDLRRLCVIRLSFVKGWGPDYPRATIKDTPCWIEVQLYRPLQLLDEVLQSMPIAEAAARSSPAAY